MKFKISPKDFLIFCLYCLLLLYLCAIAVLNFSSFINEGKFFGLNPFPAFSSDYIIITLFMFVVALIMIFTSVSSYIFNKEKGKGIGLKLGDKQESGYSRWSTEKEIKADSGVVKVDPKADKLEAAGVPLINNGKEIWVDNSEYHNLVDFGFRLPSALDNRPLRFDEFEEKTGQTIYVSATPGIYERENSQQIVEQIIRPTGLLDPEVEVRPVQNQIDDLLEEIRIRVEKNQRVLVTTLTKRMAEDLTDYMKSVGVRVRYLHSEVKTIERMEILRDLRQGEFDVLVGINLLREGLDLPEVSLVAILDADKEGFLRSETSLIQTIGRAARNAEGKVIMYGDVITGSMGKAIEETERRRALQMQYNTEHGITPKTVEKNIRAVIEATMVAEETADYTVARPVLSAKEREKRIRQLEKEMKAAAKQLEFEKAAMLRDEIQKLREEQE